MEPRLTEFSYGYCVTEEFSNGTGPTFKAAPYFPSLYAEGKAGGGFDVHIGSALFLQFKLCEELTRRTALETQRGLLEPTFFRFWLHRRDLSAQHQMLIDLESDPQNLVYYIAPGFAEVTDLDKAYNAGLVVQQSAMFSPSEIGPQPDDLRHRVSFRLDEPSGWFLPDPKPIQIHRRNTVLERALSHRQTQEMHGFADRLSDLANRMRAIIAERANLGVASKSRFAEPLAQRRDLLATVAYLARVYYGCELFFPIEPVEPAAPEKAKPRMHIEELKRRVLRALEAFFQADRYLLENNPSERCIAARVAFHLQNLLADTSDLFVDVEYNRKGIEEKRLRLPEPCISKRDEDGSSLVVPDLIVHHRGPDGPNVMILEFKKTTNPVGYDCDRQRLQAFRRELNYTAGGLVECETHGAREPAISVLEWL